LTNVASRPRGPGTRTEILRVALRLFTEKGYESTSTRDIGDALGVTKPALYYHFRNKEEIVTSLLAERRHELDEFIEWLDQQPDSPDLLETAAVRWIRSTTSERLDLMRFMHSNQPLLRRMVDSGQDIRSAFAGVIDRFASRRPDPTDRVLIRMCFDSVSASLLAARGSDQTPATVIAAATRAARALARSLADPACLSQSGPPEA